ncbi:MULTISPECIES: hypothetical protein [Halorubrum]|nr:MULTISPECIES: hypothetical protein [Halorubrum]
MHATGAGGVDDGGGVRRPLPAKERRGSGRSDGPDAAVSAGRTTADR